ncbi:hypothetical protein LWI29_007694 [Acer saccharum]|uniref:Retrovirus-related Pol polyprotein from transposon TNT 1-94-like beta-barrel domain-containing protein n=1 Tax=Acer saccharum TaxID=4024 RepID=A0AA39T0R3_ACESA|nr:hypothetical protein LWI29_007694 [Acer saccharum]
MYVLGPKLQLLIESSDKDKEKIVADQKKREEDELVCGGHIMGTLTDRLHRKFSEQNVNKTNDANMVEELGVDIVAMVSMMHIGMITELNMAVGITSSGWWLDSGATIHVCNDKTHYKIYEAANDDQMVLMGNHNRAKVLGKRTVELQFTSGKKIILTNVLHVLDIKKNLVSANLLCKSGIKTVESDKLIISKNGMFVGKGYSCDGMFKLSINNKVNSSA